MEQNLISIVFGTMGIVLGAGAWLSISKNKALLIACLGSICWCIHFLALGAVTAGISNLFIASRTFAASKVTSPKQKNLLFFTVSFVFILIAIYSWQGLISVLPVTAAIWSTFCYTFLNNLKMRYGIVASSLIWITQSFYWGSWQNILAELMRLAANFIGIKRLNSLSIK